MIGEKKDIQLAVWQDESGFIHISSESGGRWLSRIGNDPD
jgi:hypothetical protein